MGSCAGTFYALDKTSAQVKWSYNIRKDGDQNNFHGNPLITDDLVITGTDGGSRPTGIGNVYAFDIDAMDARARKEMRTSNRYQWLGEQRQSRVRRILAKSRLCILSSRMEGGANVLSEAIGAGVPILASRIEGNVGILGVHYPGYFPVSDTQQLAELLMRAETSPEYLAQLRARIKSLTSLFDPAREEKSWEDLISEVSLDKARRTGYCS